MNFFLVSDCKEIGGTEIHIIEFVKFLLGENNGVEIVTTSVLGDRLKNSEVIIHEISFKDTLLAARKIKALLNDKIDVVIAFRWKAIMSSAIACRRFEIPLIASVHSEFVPGSRYDNENRPDVDRLPSIIDNYYDGVIAPSAAIKNSLLKYGAHEEKVVVIKSFINCLNIKRLKRERKEGKVYLGYFGRLSNEKGVDMLPEICIALNECGIKNEWELHLYGRGDLESSIQTSILNANLGKKVFLKGFTDNPYGEMQKIDILVVPSRQEGLGSVIIEAMNLGIPAVCFGVGGITELIYDGQNGYLIPPFDTKLFAKKLGTLIDADALRKELSEGAIRISKELYDSKKIYKTIMRYIDKVAKAVKSNTFRLKS